MIKTLVEDFDYEQKPDNKGSYPIHLAALNGYVDIVKYFIAKKVDKNIRGTYGFTPLHYACQEGHMNVIKYLVEEAHASVTITSNSGVTPEDFARSNDQTEAAEYLSKKK